MLYAHMVKTQREFNDALVDKTIGDMLQKMSGGSAPVGATALNNMLMQLRKNCNHPDLISGGLDESIMFPSAEELVEQCGEVPPARSSAHQAQRARAQDMIFSQMTRMLDLIESYHEQKGRKVCRIDGSVPWQERKKQMDLFNTDPDYCVFLLSTRAGGLGINLTAADTVIIYDSGLEPSPGHAGDGPLPPHRADQTRPRPATGHRSQRRGQDAEPGQQQVGARKLVITKGNFRQEIGKEAEEGRRARRAAAA